ncbi:unnamed protein product [Symbiodinium natans]|uniref:Uncharacterized protein n=1 Tax=Symbiodinium natans TaxID=878477 RepID=A0A812MX21_9DINO|nr:unnamed protein product [Symbiodinium natans]
MREEEAGPTSQIRSGRVRIRLTPRHFSPLGTTFRDVRMTFLHTRFAIRAVDCEGYAWTAWSSVLPGFLSVDRCKYKIDPTGKDVLITLCPEYAYLPLTGLESLELHRPYKFENCKKNFTKYFI